MTPFAHTQKQKDLLMKVTLMMYLNQSILQLYQIYKDFRKILRLNYWFYSCIKKCYEDKHLFLLLIREKDKRHFILIKDFNTFMYDHIFHCGRKNFCRHFLQACSTEETLKCHIKDCFKIDGKQRIILPKKANTLNSKVMKEK